MKCGAIEIERGAVTKAADDVGMADTIERNCFILKILDESLFEISILITLKQHVQSFDDDLAELFVRRRQIARHVDFGIAAATETIFDVIASINPALEKFQFGHWEYYFGGAGLFSPRVSSKTLIALSSAIDVAWDRGALALFIFNTTAADANFNSVSRERLVLLSE